jgi:integrase
MKFTDKWLQSLTWTKSLNIAEKKRAQRQAKPDKGKRTYKPIRQVVFLDNLDRGLSLMLVVSYGGTKSFRVLTYVDGKPQPSYKLGIYPQMSLAQAKKKAREFFENPDRVKEREAVGTFKDIAEQWFKRYVEAQALRSGNDLRRHLERHIYPKWAKTKFLSIRRREVNDLLDHIADHHGRGLADAVLATIRSVMNWYQSRDENYTSPIVKGMRKDQRTAAQRARKRILNDNELKRLWEATEGGDMFDAFVRVSLLTAQRRAKVAQMRWDDIVDGTWIIRSEEREKGTAGKLKLLESVLEALGKLPRIAGNPYVFAGRGGKAFNSYSQRKEELDRKLPDMEPWTLHDLRRTARSLMSRAGVSSDHAERVLGHAIPGVEGVYDRHSYEPEKADALERLGHLIETIVNPPDGNVVALRR